MKRKYGFLFSLILLLMIPTTAYGQLWTGIIDPSRAIDWSKAGIPGGIPNRTTICATLNPGATSAQINSAIASCPANQVVFLNAGTYTIASGINFGSTNNVTLRGAGPDQTILNFTGGDNCGGLGGDICAINSTGYAACCSSPVQSGGGNSANWTGGYAQGTTQITLSNVSGLSAGSVIFVDQLDDASDTNGVYVCQTYGPCGNDVPGGAGRSGRGQLEIKRITAISGSTVTISSGLYNTNWRSSQSPGAWWVGSMLTGVGVENMTVNHNGSANGKAGIYFFNVFQGWVKNVKSINANRNHVWIYQSAQIIVRDSYFYGTQNNASQSYGVETYMSADALIENNIFQHMPAGILSDSTAGLVAGYNFDIDHAYTVSTWQQAGHYLHGVGTSMNLREGNNSDGLTADNIHGTHSQETLFRNQFTGLDPGKTQQTVPILLYTHSREFNVIGNVLGTVGYHNNYEDSILNGLLGNSERSIYVLGFCENVDLISLLSCSVNGTMMLNDSLTASTLFRWGNYDVATGTVRWNASEVPTAATPYVNGNPVPASQSLPASFYLSSKPSWWGTTPWPAIGPEVTGGTGPGGHSYAIPAQTCYNNTPKDSSGILAFNANNCYGAVTLPAAPTNLSVIVN